MRRPLTKLRPLDTTPWQTPWQTLPFAEVPRFPRDCLGGILNVDSTIHSANEHSAACQGNDNFPISFCLAVCRSSRNLAQVRPCCKATF